MGRSGTRKSTKRKQANRRRSQQRARREEMARRIQELAEAKLEAILDPELPAEESAAELLDLFAPELPEIGISVVIASRSTPERAREVAEAALRLGPESPTALALAAEVAELDEDIERAEELLHAAMERSDDPELGWRHAAVRLSAGRVADVLEELDATCAADPLDDDAQALRAKALEEALGRARGDPGRPCPCGSGRSHRRCCRKRERRAVDRFEDRGPLDDLRRSLATFSSHVRFDPIREATSEDWRAVDLNALGPGVDRLAEEWSWLVVPADPERPEGPENTLLARFAAEPSTLPVQAARAREWLDSARYGLWQVADPAPRPGVWLTDILSGVDRYVAMPPDQVEGLARWTVVLGCLVPVDGVWRAGGAFLPLTPTLGDVLAERVHEVASRIEVERRRPGRPGGRRRSGSPGRRGRAGGGQPPPFGVTATLDEPASPEVAAVLSWLVAASLPELVSWVQEQTGRWPALTNTDGDPLLFLTARIEVSDPADVRRRLGSHADFRDQGDQVVWYGRELTDTELETNLAEARAFARRQGTELVEEDVERRWIRGFLRFEGDHLAAEVNSRERVDRLLALLRDMGTRPRIVSEHRVDPDQDFPTPADLAATGGAEPSRGMGMSQEAVDAWQRTWLDEPVPALEGRTPRQAARDEEGRVHLEALLREFEHLADRARARGDAAPDVARLRMELGMRDGAEGNWLEEAGVTVPRVELGEAPTVGALERRAGPTVGGLERGNATLDRRTWTVPPAEGAVMGIELSDLDPADEDDRHFLILGEHPELVPAIERDEDEVEVEGLRFNPRMHLAIHEVIANQLWDDDPPEVWATARRLVALGYERHEILHMLGSVVTTELWGSLRHGRPYDPAQYRAALDGLPESWGRRRDA